MGFAGLRFISFLRECGGRVFWRHVRGFVRMGCGDPETSKLSEKALPLTPRSLRSRRPSPARGEGNGGARFARGTLILLAAIILLCGNVVNAEEAGEWPAGWLFRVRAAAKEKAESYD